MKISKLLNKIYFSIIFILFSGTYLLSEEQPVDIWNTDKKKIENESSNNTSILENDLKNETGSSSSIYKMQVKKKNNSIELVEELNTKKNDIIGLYDPEDNSLDINMWNNSDGDQLKQIFSKLNKIKLSSDATEIMKISLLTNAYYPKKKYN